MSSINYRQAAQDRLCRELAKFDHPLWQDKPYGSRLYGLDNNFFTGRDVYCMSAMIQRLRPQKIVEVGSGWSTLAMMDIRNHANLNTEMASFDKDIHRLVEPGGRLPIYPGLTIHEEDVRFSGNFIEHALNLHENDILFIDGDHNGSSKGQASFIINEALPMLNAGVVICWHDIWPDWKLTTPNEDGGEQAILRAFLSYNTDFEILLWLPQYAENNPSFLAYAPAAGEYAGSLMYVTKRTP